MRVDPKTGYVLDVLDHTCPSRMTLELLADKWSLLVIVALDYKGTLRNTQLKRLLGDISPKMLTQTLRKLEHCGIVNRISYNEVPPRVEYELTELGKTLRVPIRALSDWAELYFCDVTEAQEQAKTN